MEAIETGLTVVKSDTELFEIESGVPANQLAQLVDVFEPFAIQAVQLIDAANKITVTGEDDTVGMNAAKNAAKEFVALIKDLDEAHKREKTVAKRITDTVDGIRKQIKDKLVETKDQLRYLADTAKRAEEKRRQKLAEERREKLLPYLAPGDSITSDLDTMDETTFNTILEGMVAKKLQREQQAKIEALEREKAEREAKEKRDQEIQEAQEKARQEAQETARLREERLQQEAEDLKQRNAELQASIAEAPVKRTISEIQADEMIAMGRIQTAGDLARDLIDKYADSMDGEVIEYLETFI